MNPGAACRDLEYDLNHRGHAEHEGSGNSRFVRSSVMPCASPSGLLAGKTREHVGKRYLSFFPFFVFFVSSVVQSSALIVLPAPLCRLHAAAVPHQTMKAFLPILVRFAFIVFFASIVVVESLRS